MSTLTKFLNTQTHRKKMKEGGGGLKTPLTMKMNPHPDLDDFFVSTTKGTLQCVPNNNKGVPTNFFSLELDDEDLFHVRLIDSIFLESLEKNWGNVALIESLTENDITDILEYFLEYELELSRIFCSYQGYQSLQNTGILVHPSGTDLPECPSPDVLKSWQKEHIVVGMLEDKPVFLNEALGPYLAFSAHPSFVGMLTRIDLSVSVFVHNAERGVVILRLPENSEGSEET